MYLLDTNVISELRKAKSGRADPQVSAWARGIASTDLFLSVISVLELELGVLLALRRDPVQGAHLRTWLAAQVLPAFAGRILAVDTAVARCCAGLHVPDPKADRDALIAGDGEAQDEFGRGHGDALLGDCHRGLGQPSPYMVSDRGRRTPLSGPVWVMSGSGNQNEAMRLIR